MNKWYHPFGLMLLAAMVGDLTGCAQSSGWLAKKPAKKASEEKLAAADKTSRDKKSKKNKLDDESVAKSDKTSSEKKSGKKAVDAEHEKYAAIDVLKKKKPAPVDPFAEDTKSTVAAATKPAKANKPKPKSDATKPDDEMDLLLAKANAPEKTAKKPALKSSTPDELLAADDEPRPPKTTRKKVVQVKKEVTKSSEKEDASDWSTDETDVDSKPVKSANIAESFEDELESPFAVKNEKSTAKSKIAKQAVDSESEDDAAEFSAPTTKKVAIKKESGKDLQALSPTADMELSELIKSLDQSDPESLKQGLHRIGQMGRDGVPAAPLLRKMLKHEDPFVRAHSALAMARLNLSSNESAAVVVESLKSRNASLRSFGVAVLSEMGPFAGEVLSSLATGLNDRDGQVRLRAAEVLIHNEEWALPSLQTLLSCLKDKDENVRWLATYSIAELRPEDSPEIVQGLLKAAHDRAPRVQAGAIYALAEIGPYAKRTSDELRKIREASNDDEVKTSVDYALKQLNP